MHRFINSIFKTVIWITYFRLNHSKYQQYDVQTKIPLNLKVFTNFNEWPYSDKENTLGSKLSKPLNIINASIRSALSRLSNFFRTVIVLVAWLRCVVVSGIEPRASRIYERESSELTHTIAEMCGPCDTRHRHALSALYTNDKASGEWNWLYTRERFTLCSDSWQVAWLSTPWPSLETEYKWPFMVLYVCCEP